MITQSYKAILFIDLLQSVLWTYQLIVRLDNIVGSNSQFEKKLIQQITLHAHSEFREQKSETATGVDIMQPMAARQLWIFARGHFAIEEGEELLQSDSRATDCNAGRL